MEFDRLGQSKHWDPMCVLAADVNRVMLASENSLTVTMKPVAVPQVLETIVGTI